MTVDMQVINLRNNPNVESFARNEIQRVAEHFETRLGRVTMHVSDEGHSERHSPKRCSVDFRVLGNGVSHVEAKAENTYAAIRKAIARMEHALSKRLRRRTRETIRHPDAGDEPTDVLEVEDV